MHPINSDFEIYVHLKIILINNLINMQADVRSNSAYKISREFTR